MALKLRKRHTRFLDKDYSRLPINPPDKDLDAELRKLHAQARRWDATVVEKDLLNWKDKTSHALLWVILLGAKFSERPKWQQVSTFRHELSHIFIQRLHGEFLFSIRYAYERWRFVYEIGAETESVFAEAYILGPSKQDVIERWIERYLDKMLRRDGTYKFKRLDKKQAKAIGRAALHRAMRDGFTRR